MKPTKASLNVIGPVGVVFLLLVGCQGNPQKDASAWSGQATPTQISAGEQMPARGDTLTWAGRVQAVHNRASVTLIEVLAYPMNEHAQPQVDEPASGRFMIEMQGFLEPNDFPGGTPVSVQGRYAGLYDGKVGEADYAFPLLLGDKLDVWKPEEIETRKPEVRWSIGIGTGGSGVGVGIGF